MRTSRSFPSCLILMLFAALVAQSLNAEEKAIEQYSASIMIVGSAKGRTPITIRIFSYTPDEEVAKLAELLKTKGQDAVADAIWKTARGHIAPVGGVGIDINYARVLNTEKGKVIRMVSARQMPFWEQSSGRPSTDYPFSILDLTIGSDGRMEGKVIAKAKVEINKENVLQLNSYGSQTIILNNIKKDD